MQSMHIESIDDLTGEKAQETVHFEIDGTRYEIDLTAKNAAQLRSTLSGYIKKSQTTASRSAHQHRQYGYTVDQDKRESSKDFDAGLVLLAITPASTAQYLPQSWMLTTTHTRTEKD